MLNSLIGNTPMIKINYEYEGKKSSIYAKLEYYNLTGSIKDRVAYYMINDAKKSGKLLDGMPIIEATSGNTGISLAALGAYYKHQVYIFMPDWVSPERLKLMELYGAKVKLFSATDGGFTRCIKEAEKLSKKINGFLTNQFSNISNINAHYNTTGEEIVNKISDIGGFVSGVGTGGTLIGIGSKILEYNPLASIYALEPENMSLMKMGTKGSHKIDGIGDEFIPALVDRTIIKDIVLISDYDAINMSKKLSLELGLGVGISSGANAVASIILNESVNGKMVTVFADDSKKYLSSDLTKKIENNNKSISNNIKLIDYEIL